MILYFSASGNSRFIAEHAAALLEDEACSLNARIRLDQHDPLESARPYVLVCPTYAWRIPRIVEEHLRHTELKLSLIHISCTTHRYGFPDNCLPVPLPFPVPRTMRSVRGYGS